MSWFLSLLSVYGYYFFYIKIMLPIKSNQDGKNSTINSVDIFYYHELVFITTISLKMICCYFSISKYMYIYYIYLILNLNYNNK